MQPDSLVAQRHHGSTRTARRTGNQAARRATTVNTKAAKANTRAWFGASPLALAGLYGVMSYTVAQRRAEIGVRMALGAQRSEVIRMILNQGSRLVFPGVALGAVLAFAAGRLFVALVYGVKTSDPPTFIGVAAAITVVALLAMYIPARRAARVDPMLAVRSE